MTTLNGAFPHAAGDAARLYIGMGMCPIPVPTRTKKAILKEWEKLRLTAENIHKHFPPGQLSNIGILNGSPSKNLIDVDLDCPEACKAAPLLLPATGMIFGRKSAPRSHWIYKTDVAFDKASNGDDFIDSIRGMDVSRCGLVELRGTGGMTVYPPSIHEGTGELIEWHRFDNPGEVFLRDLQKVVAEVAAAALLGRYWPAQGSRHPAALALAGGLKRAGWNQEHTERFVEAVATAAGDEEIRSRVRDVASTFAQEAGDNTTGWPTLAEKLTRNGLPGQNVLDEVFKWLSIRTEGKGKNRQVEGGLREPKLICMADVKPELVQWLWKNRIPLGSITLVVGRPGGGKSFLMTDLAARVSTGRSFPDNSPCPSGSAIIISAEDNPNDTIRPRLDACQADPKRVFILEGVQHTAKDGTKTEQSFTLADVPILEAALKLHPECKLVVIDPIGSYLGGKIDAHRDNEVRSVLAPVADLARRFNTAVVIVAHRRKTEGNFADDTALGSRAFTGIARAVWHVSKETGGSDRRLLLPGKNNLTSEGYGLAFQIEGQPARIVWDEAPVTITADDAQHAEASEAASKRKPGPSSDGRQQAARWLEEQLKDGPVPRGDLEDRAKIAGHPWRTVERASQELGVFKARGGYGKPSTWNLPSQPARQDAPDQSRQDPPDQSRQDPQEGPNVVSWRDCKNTEKIEDFAPAPSIPAKIPEYGGNGAEPPFILITDAPRLGTLKGAIEESSLVAVDCETTGLDPRSDRIRLLSLSVDTIDGGTFAYLVDCFVLDPSPLWEVLAGKELILHNAAFDLAFLARLGFTPEATIHDTMLLAKLLTAGTLDKVNLAACCQRWLQRGVDKAEQAGDWSGRLTSSQLVYAAGDVEVLLPLLRALEVEIKAAGLTDAAQIEGNCLPAMVWLASSGVAFDREAWQALARDAHLEAERLAGELDQSVPRPPGSLFDGGWKWDSPEQVKEAFAMAGIHLDDTTDETLAGINHQAARLLREYRSAKKRETGYGFDWLKHVADNGRVYPDWRQIGADSGRMSCRSPNMQQLPRGEYRRCIVAPPGRVLVKADYSQIELRIAAKVSGDKALLEAYRNGDDLHTRTAREVLGIKEVTKEHRQLAKALNFGLLYGMGARGFLEYAKSNYGVKLTEEQARRYREAFFRSYPGLASWHRRVRNEKASETRTLYSRRRLLTDRTPDTQRLNTPVQGTGADGLKLALALLLERRKQPYRGSLDGAFPVLAVHDEIVIECDAAQARDVATWLKAGMIEAMADALAPIPVEVEVKIAQTWGGD